jgi:hypothetical protein
MAKEYVEITIRYLREDPDIPIEEEIAHWTKGTIDVPTFDGDNEISVTGKIVEA